MKTSTIKIQISLIIFYANFSANYTVINLLHIECTLFTNYLSHVAEGDVVSSRAANALVTVADDVDQLSTENEKYRCAFYEEMLTNRLTDIKCEQLMIGSFVQVMVKTHNYMHFREVEVYGPL